MDRPARRPGPPVDAARLQPDNQGDIHRVDTAHFAAHGDISGFGGIFEQLSRHGGDAGHTP